MLEVGRIDRPHGLHGEVVVTLTSDRLERLAPGSVLATDRGPLAVRSSRPHQHRHLVRFDRILDRDDAETWRSVVLSAEALDDPGGDTFWVHELIGCTLLDQHGDEYGTVVSVHQNPASDLLELDDGRLVPMAFLTGHVPGERIEVDVPDGLLYDIEGG